MLFVKRTQTCVLGRQPSEARNVDDETDGASVATEVDVFAGDRLHGEVVHVSHGFDGTSVAVHSPVSYREPSEGDVMTKFRGWPDSAFDFYARLAMNNTKTFWQANRTIYEDAVRAPFDALSDAIESEYGRLRVFRPHRDVRFSKDKSPYKTAAGAVAEGEDGAISYVQMSADGLFVGSGYYHLASDQLMRWREAVDDEKRGNAIVDIVAALVKRRLEIGAMDTLKTAPRGYPRDHPRVELLRMKGLTAGKSFPVARWMHTPSAAERIVSIWSECAPMNEWLARQVGPSTLAPPEP